MTRKPITAFLIVAAGAWLGAVGAGRAADPSSKLPALQRPIEAANIPQSFVVVDGTVTVRVQGVLVNPTSVTYAFDPEFKFSNGYLTPASDGIFRLHANNVPADNSYTLIIKAAYNDTVVRDGVVLRLGKTYSGSIRISIPYGRDYSFGDQLLDLN